MAGPMTPELPTAADLAAHAVSTIARMGIAKAHGGAVPMPLVSAALEQAFEFGLEHVRGRMDDAAAWIESARETEKGLRQNEKALRKISKTIKAIAEPAPADSPFGPVIAPYGPDQWRTGLIPVFPPQPANGHSMPLPGIGEPNG